MKQLLVAWRELRSRTKSPGEHIRDRARQRQPVWQVVLVAASMALAGSLAVATGATGASGPTASPVAPTSTGAPTIPAKMDCAAFVQDGGTRNAHVPDFLKIPGAPTRITSASIVPATATQPAFCDVHGYVQPQTEFELKLPTSTWQGRYLQFGCAGVCGFISQTAFPACRTQLGGDFAIAATNDGHNARPTDAMWAGTDEQHRIDYGYRSVHSWQPRRRRSRPPTTTNRRGTPTLPAVPTAAVKG